MASNNILMITPFSDKFYDVAFESLKAAFMNNDPDEMEIEFKHAELRGFMNYPPDRELNNLPQNIQQKIFNQNMNQSNYFLSMLGTISKQNVIYLNPLGRNAYHIKADFDEPNHKKFYHIR
jgi:hypothetical protein